jgi:cytochrome c oxidase subunit IV
MSAQAGENREHEEVREHVHPTAAVYILVAVVLAILTGMEVTVYSVGALRPVLVPLLLILAAAKFSLVAMFYMHLRYERWVLNSIFLSALIIATVLLVSLVLLFAYLSHHLAVGYLH